MLDLLGDRLRVTLPRVRLPERGRGQVEHGELPDVRRHDDGRVDDEHGQLVHLRKMRGLAKYCGLLCQR